MNNIDWYEWSEKALGQENDASRGGVDIVEEKEISASQKPDTVQQSEDVEAARQDAQEGLEDETYHQVGDKSSETPPVDQQADMTPEPDVVTHKAGEAPDATSKEDSVGDVSSAEQSPSEEDSTPSSTKPPPEFLGHLPGSVSDDELPPAMRFDEPVVKSPEVDRTANADATDAADVVGDVGDDVAPQSPRGDDGLDADATPPHESKFNDDPTFSPTPYTLDVDRDVPVPSEIGGVEVMSVESPVKISEQITWAEDYIPLSVLDNEMGDGVMLENQEEGEDSSVQSETQQVADRRFVQ